MCQCTDISTLRYVALGACFRDPKASCSRYRCRCDWRRWRRCGWFAGECEKNMELSSRPRCWGRERRLLLLYAHVCQGVSIRRGTHGAAGTCASLFPSPSSPPVFIADSSLPSCGYASYQRVRLGSWSLAPDPSPLDSWCAQVLGRRHLRCVWCCLRS